MSPRTGRKDAQSITQLAQMESSAIQLLRTGVQSLPCILAYDARLVGQVSRAIQVLQQALKLTKQEGAAWRSDAQRTHMRARVLAALATCHKRRGDLPAAETCMNRVLRELDRCACMALRRIVTWR